MTKTLLEYNIELSTTQGVAIDIECAPAIAAYKLKLLYLRTFPTTFYIKMTADNQEKEWQILAKCVEFFNESNAIFTHCHSNLHSACYNGFSLVGDDEKSIFLFVSKNNSLPILVKGIKNKIDSISIFNTDTTLSYKQSNRLHSSAGVIWITPSNGTLKHDLNIIEMRLRSPLKLYLGSGAPITQN